MTHSAPRLNPSEVRRGHSRVEAEPKLARNERVSQRARVSARIWQDVWFCGKDGRCTQARLPTDLVYRHPMMRFEPDAITIDNADNRDRDIKSACSQRGDVHAADKRRDVDRLRFEVLPAGERKHALCQGRASLCGLDGVVH